MKILILLSLFISPLVSSAEEVSPEYMRGLKDGLSSCGAVSHVCIHQISGSVGKAKSERLAKELAIAGCKENPRLYFHYRCENEKEVKCNKE